MLRNAASERPIAVRCEAIAAMHKKQLLRPDGRALTLYARAPIVGKIQAASPKITPVDPNPHLRWHPLRAEWVAYAGHRQNRTFLPPLEYNPLAPSTDPAHPTEVPPGPWDVAVFDNLFPTFSMTAHDPPSLIVPTKPAPGACEVVVFTQDSTSSLGRLPLWHLELVLEVWGDRYVTLGERREILYVFPFENRGVEVGVTLHHPHGQVYGYPVVPPIPACALEQQREYLREHGTGLLEDFIARETAEKIRMLYDGMAAAAFMPVCARYAYEVWVAPRRAAASLAALTAAERRDFARALKTVLLQLDGLWNRSMPYILAFYQAPTDGAAHPEAHLHAQIYPALRMPNRLKYLAGSEIGAGVFTADTLPEQSAAELQAVSVDIDA
jgi:UDPglucose--hexose-1-phosphate uridylyltransferase